VVFISSSFLTDVNDFLSLLLIWIGPFAGVWLVDGTLRRWSYDPVDIHAIRAGTRYWGWQGINVKGLVAMLAGAVGCVLTIDSPILHGPVSKALGGADLTWILGPVVAGALYFVLARSDVRASAPVPAAHLRQAVAMGEQVAIHEGLLPHDRGPVFEASQPVAD